MSDVFVVIHLATTGDDQGAYVSRDTAEVIEVAWKLLDAHTLDELARDSVLIRPVNTPITPACTSLSTLTWEHVRSAGTFKDAVSKLDSFIHDRITAKGLDFTFVTLSAWDLRVQLPREARDKSVVLPPYLQHARVFDLKQEYSRWQAHHPEALSYSASNLQSIITALEVELDTVPSSSTPPTPTPQSSESVRSASPSSTVTPVSTNSSLSTQPRRAADEVNLLSSILKALAKKSIPLEDHPDVLTRPFDARADVRAFLAERSKVLHLSNLPNDTTQSELESWFTQYGGRPIAFWTLKTPDQHKPTGSGFAVFSSHEEASESLAMNGRALNEKSIEVQPSSARVLDRAQEILTPFPPSKNRPRPGDWTCPSCGFSNFQRRTACFRCSFPAASAAAIQESMYTGQPQSQSQQQPQPQQHQSVPPQPQQQLPPQQPQHQQQSNGHMIQNNHGNNNHNQLHHNNHHGNNSNNSQNNHQSQNNNGQQRVSSVPFRAGDWKCGNEGCAYHNFAKNICCLRCGAPRVQQMGGQQTPHQQQQQGQSTQTQSMNMGMNQMGMSQPLMTQSQPQQIPIQQGYYNGYDGEMKDLSSKMGNIALGYMKD